MGFKAQRKTIKLQFETAELAGLEVSARVLSLGRMLDVADLADRARAGAGLSEVRELVVAFSDALDSWNVEDEASGEPVARNVDGVLSLDSDLALAMILAWFDGMVSISTNLGKGSTSGERSPEAAIPMEALSNDPGNSPTPN